MPIHPAVRTLLAVPLLVVGAVSAQPRYAMTDLQSLLTDAYQASPVDLNNNGQVLFSGTDLGSGESTAWLYTPGSAPLNLLSAVDHVPAPGHRLRLEASGLNDRGQVAGMWDTAAPRAEPVPWQAFVFDARTGGLTVLNDAVGGPGIAYEINNRGQVAGFRDVPHQSRQTYVHDTVSGTTTFTGDVQLGFGDGGLNNRGQLAGTTFDVAAQLPRTAVFDTATGTTTDLGDGGIGSRPYGINNDGWVVGEQYDDALLRRPFLYRPDSGFADLGLLPGLPSFAEGTASDINAGGQVVGNFYYLDGDAYATHGFLHDARWGLLAVENLIVSSTVDDWRSVGVSAVNDAGQMVGTARSADGTWRSVLLTPLVAGPVPEPGTLGLLAVGLAGVGWRLRRARPLSR